MCDAVSIGYGLMAVTAAASVHQAEQSRKQANRAADMARADADKAFNRENQKKPNTLLMSDANLRGMSGGAGSTMLTGAQGIAPSALSLGRQTLLGG